MTCRSCLRLLPKIHFTATGIRFAKHRDNQICVACRRACIVCGEVLPQSNFHSGSASSGDRLRRRDLSVESSNDEAGDVCARCKVARDAAMSNVYYRFPVLHFKQAPYSAETYRQRMADGKRIASRSAHADGAGDD